MRFKKLRIFVGIALVLFFIIVANTIAFGLINKDQSMQTNLAAYDNKTTNNAVVAQAVPPTTVDTSQTTPTTVDNSQNTPTIVQPQPVIINQRIRTRAS